MDEVVPFADRDINVFGDRVDGWGDIIVPSTHLIAREDSGAWWSTQGIVPTGPWQSYAGIFNFSDARCRFMLSMNFDKTVI